MNKRIHIIGIAGVATSAIAVMFKNIGWIVTGSDKAFFPPVSQYLKDNGIDILVGFDPQHLYDNKGELPDLVMYQGGKGEKNPEIVKTRELGIELVTYPEVIKRYVIVPNSIAVAGTYGKTSILSMLVEMFEAAGKEISYLYGGVPIGKKVNAKVKTDKTEYSLVEGDEYIISLTDKRSKFSLYSPKYLILNAIQWEHLDIFKTEDDYVNNFIELVSQIPSDGIIVANAADANVVKAVSNAKCKVVYYAVSEILGKVKPDWVLLKSSHPLPCFIREEKGDIKLEIIPYEKKIIGDFNEENFLAAAVLAYELGIKKERIQEAIRNYKGIKRRLELKFDSQKLKVFEDLGSSPPKAKGSIKAVRDDYPDANLVAVFEPNAGNRVLSSLPLYDNLFENVNKVFLPRFSHLPKNESLDRFDEKALCEYLLPDTDIEVHSNDEELVDSVYEYCIQNKNKLTIVMFMSSHSLRGMLEDLVMKLKNSSEIKNGKAALD